MGIQNIKRYREKGTSAPQRNAPSGRIPHNAVHSRKALFFWSGLFILLSLLQSPAGFAADESMRGKASWYGTTAHGKKTANGEVFSRHALTAAHRTLPFGSILRVYNLKNGRQALVRVNDRGPFSRGRVVDVSKRAAELLKMTQAGVAHVAIEVAGSSAGVPLNRENSFYLHITDERTAQKAHALSSSLAKRLKKPIRALFSVQSEHPTYALCLGPYKNFEDAQNDFSLFEEKGIEFKGIIEAPTKGGDIPRHVPPKPEPKQPKPAKAAGKGKSAQAAPKDKNTRKK